MAAPPPLAQKQSTTLGQSMGQLNKPKSGWGPLLWAGSAGLLLTAVATMGWQAHSVSGPSSVPHVQGAATAAARGSSDPRPIHPAPMAPALVLWSVETLPSGATVLDEHGNQLGKTPWTQEVPAHAGTVKLRVQNRGYQDETLELDAAHETSRQLHMTRLPPAKSVRARLRMKPKNPPPSPKSPIRKIYED